MAFKTGALDQRENARLKQASRENDKTRLASGEVSRAELARENGFLTSLPLHEFKLDRIGDRRLGRGRNS